MHFGWGHRHRWFETAFAGLACAAHMAPALQAVLRATSRQERGQQPATAYEIAAGLHNALGSTDLVPAQAVPCCERPILVIRGDAMARTILDTNEAPAAKTLPSGAGKLDEPVDVAGVPDSTERCNTPHCLVKEP